MKNIFIVFALFGFFTTPAFSQDNHTHNPDAVASGMAAQPTQMPDLQVQMEKMKLLMERIRLEQNPEVREKLVQEHMVAMEHGMQMMSESMEKNSQMKSMSTDKRIDMMTDRMDMMQQMMQQMIGQMKGGMGMSEGGHM